MSEIRVSVSDLSLCVCLIERTASLHLHLPVAPRLHQRRSGKRTTDS
jgi:hypothetical protein